MAQHGAYWPIADAAALDPRLHYKLGLDLARGYCRRNGLDFHDLHDLTVELLTPAEINGQRLTYTLDDGTEMPETYGLAVRFEA